MISRGWTVRLSAAARADVEQIVSRTADVFGEAQARTYAETLSLALKALEAGPDIIGVKLRTDIGAGLRTFHIARNRRRGRHVVLFRVNDVPGERQIVVLRILHDAMDITRHVSVQDDKS